MTSRNRTLPPLNALRAFEAAARLMSFTAAARELHVTQAAISQQVRVLEEWFGRSLFRRGRPGTFSLTPAGKTYWPEVRAGLDHLAEATDRVMDDQKDRACVRVMGMASFVSQWLVPRLPDFCVAHPEVTLRVSGGHRLLDTELEDATARLVDIDQDQADITVRYGHGQWVGIEAEPLLSERVFPVCSPALVEDGRLKKPADLASHTLLHDMLPEDWGMWLRAAGARQVASDQGLTFTHTHLMLQAACLGLGVGLGRDMLMGDTLQKKTLIRPFSTEISASHSYYVVVNPVAEDKPHVGLFLAWLRAQASMCGGHSGSLPAADASKQN